jgi:ribose-phosphate pyrophosphokinase
MLQSTSAEETTFMVDSYHPLRIFAGSAHPHLAQSIADILGVELGRATTTNLPDSEIHVMIDEVVRDQDIFIVQPCSVPVNDNLIELLLYLDALRRASAHSISVVIPYFPYARQERMARGREAISARVVANMLEESGADRVIFVDIHARAIQGFFNIPVDPLSALPLLADFFRKPEYANDCEPRCRSSGHGRTLCRAAQPAAGRHAQAAH